MQTHAHLPDNKIKLFGSLTDFGTAPSPLPFSEFLCHKVNHGANLLIIHTHTHSHLHLHCINVFVACKFDFAFCLFRAASVFPQHSGTISKYIKQTLTNWNSL